MVQMFLMQTIPQSAEQEKFVLKRIISSICFRGMLTLKLKYSTVEINMVNYFTTKPYNGDNPYHKELFYFPEKQIQKAQYKNNGGKLHWLLYVILYYNYQNPPPSCCRYHQSGAHFSSQASLLQSSYNQVCSRPRKTIESKKTKNLPSVSQSKDMENSHIKC